MRASMSAGVAGSDRQSGSAATPHGRERHPAGPDTTPARNKSPHVLGGTCRATCTSRPPVTAHPHPRTKLGGNGGRPRAIRPHTVTARIVRGKEAASLRLDSPQRVSSSFGPVPAPPTCEVVGGWRPARPRPRSRDVNAVAAFVNGLGGLQPGSPPLPHRP
jgi:hypothetical protein